MPIVKEGSQLYVWACGCKWCGKVVWSNNEINYDGYIAIDSKTGKILHSCKNYSKYSNRKSEEEILGCSE